MNDGESPACLADLLILEARALSALGEKERAASTIVEAERVFGQVVPDNEPEWARFIDPAYFFGEAAHVSVISVNRSALTGLQANPLRLHNFRGVHVEEL